MDMGLAFVAAMFAVLLVVGAFAETPVIAGPSAPPQTDFTMTPPSGLLGAGRFSEPSIKNSALMYSDLFGVVVEHGFRVYAFTTNASIGTPYRQQVGAAVDAGWVSFSPVLNGVYGKDSSDNAASPKTRTVEYDAYHGIYEKLWSSGVGTVTLDASAWVGFPYSRYDATFYPSAAGNASGSYIIKWWAANTGPTDFLIPSQSGYVLDAVTSNTPITVSGQGLTDNFILLWGKADYVELVSFERKPTTITYSPQSQSISISYPALPVQTEAADAFPNICVGFLKVTDNNLPTSNEMVTAVQMAHASLTFPQSTSITVTTGSAVTVTYMYTYYYSANDWGIESLPIIPIPYAMSPSTAPLFTARAVWGMIQYVEADTSGSVSFTVSPNIPDDFTLSGMRQLAAGSNESNTVYAAIDYIAANQGTEGEWDGLAYHDGRTITYLLVIYPALDSAYQNKVAGIAQKTLSSYFQNAVVFNQSLGAYRITDMNTKTWTSEVDIGALTSWMFYAALLYTKYVDPTFTSKNFQSIMNVERGMEKVVDWSGVSWANPANPDTSGELIIETAMGFLTYYFLAQQNGNQNEMGRAEYFVGMTQNFMLNVFERPESYWSYPGEVGTYVPGAVSDNIGPPTVQWNWVNTVWGMWMPAMAESYTQTYVNGIDQTAVKDWSWDNPASPRFDPEYLDFNMLLSSLGENDARVPNMIMNWWQTNNGTRLYAGAMGAAEQAANIVYGMLPPQKDAGLTPNSTPSY